VLPEVLTVRLLVLAVVVLISFVLLLPTVRGAVQQRAQIDQLQAELDASTAERDELRTELERWDDRSYVVQQARSRLSYVLPGDTAWMVVDAEAIEGEPEPAASAGGPVAATSPAGAPWYQAMWESVQVTDRAAAPDEPTASPRPTPAGSGSPAPEESPSQESGGE
jgi:cell division protein FtsB